MSRGVGLTCLATALSLALGSCNLGALDVGFGVATTVVFDSSVSDATLGRVTALTVSVTGDESYSTSEPISKPARTERFVYRPLSSSRVILITVSAVDVTHSIVASGQSGVVMLTPGASAQADIVLHAGTSTGADGGGTDHGMGPFDASVVDAAGGSSRCNQLTQSDDAIACYGYEQSSDISDITQNGGTVALDTSRYFRGSSSMHATTSPSTTPMDAFALSSEATANYEYETPTVGQEVHFRAFVYLSTLGGSAELFDVMSQLCPYGCTYNITAMALGVNSDGSLYTKRWVTSDAGFAGTESTVQSATKIPLNTWTCVEFAYLPTTMNYGFVKTYVNETEITDLDYTGPTYGTGSEEAPFYLSLGLTFTEGATQSEGWFDELMIATKQIGCEE